MNDTQNSGGQGPNGGSQSPNGGSPEQIAADISALSFEAALKQLKDVVQRLESGDVDLEESIEIYSRGTELRRHCEAKLKAAQEKVEKLAPSPGGEVTASEPFEVE